MQTKTSALWVIACLLLASAMSCSQAPSNVSLLGTWKGIDQYGHEHYFEFQKDGKLVWWDMERSSPDGPYEKRGTFNGHYNRIRNGQIALSDGYQPIGVLTDRGIELKQDDSGHAMRKGLIYKKVAKD